MKKFLTKTNFIIGFVIFICLILFLPGFFTYFHQDDFIHLSYSQTLSQVIAAFNIFQKGEFPFYRPIPTQLYFYLGKSIFGFNPLGYHIVNFLIFCLNVFLVFRLVRFITKSQITALIAIIFFAVNSTHFAPLYSAAYVHELFYVLFGVLTVGNFLQKNYLRSMLFFIAALMTKETAVVLPTIIVLIYVFTEKKIIPAKLLKISTPYFVILSVYLFAHFIYYGIATGPSYSFIFGKPTLNILAWYFLWALSTPNILIDFIGPGLRINPVFFQVSQINGIIYFVLFPLLIIFGSVLLIKLAGLAVRDKNWHKLKPVLFGMCWFVVGMIPLIIFPLHKLATEQAFSLVGLSMALASLTVAVYKHTKIYKALSIIFIITYIVIAVNSILLGRKTHWIVISARQAHETISFLETNYPKLPDDAIIYFRNGEIKIAPYGSSRQLYQALGNGSGLKLVLNKPHLQLYFEDLGQVPPKVKQDKKIIQIDSSKLLGY